MLALLAAVSGRPFGAGVLISSIAAISLLVGVYHLSRLSFDLRAARLATIITAAAGAFVVNAISVNTDMLYAALLVWTVVVLMGGKKDVKTAVLAGALGGAAWDVRITAVVILPLLVVWAMMAPRGKRGGLYRWD